LFYILSVYSNLILQKSNLITWNQTLTVKKKDTQTKFFTSLELDFFRVQLKFGFRIRQLIFYLFYCLSEKWDKKQKRHYWVVGELYPKRKSKLYLLLDQNQKLKLQTFETSRNLRLKKQITLILFLNSLHFLISFLSLSNQYWTN